MSKPASTERSRDASGLNVERAVVRAKGYVIDPVTGGLLAGNASSHSSDVAQVEVTVVLPVYNEAGLIERTFEAVAEFARINGAYRFVFVDDGSRDQTARFLQRRCAELTSSADPAAGRIEIMALTPNRGKGHAVKTGVLSATSPIVLFTDGDLAYSLDHLPTLVASLESADVVIGNRNLVHKHERNTTALRKLMGWTFNRCARVMLGLRYSDTQAGLKGFRIEAARQVFALEHLGGFAFDVELVYLATRLGLRIAEVPAYVAEAHSYKVSKVNLFRDPMRMFGSLLDVRMTALRGRYGPRRRKVHP